MKNKPTDTKKLESLEYVPDGHEPATRREGKHKLIMAGYCKKHDVYYQPSCVCYKCEPESREPAVVANGCDVRIEPNKILNKELQAFLTEMHRQETGDFSNKIIDGALLRFNGKDNDYPGVGPLGEWVYSSKGHQWYRRKVDWRVGAKEESCKTCKGFGDKYCVDTFTMVPCPDCDQETIIITAQHAASLAALVKHWKELLKHIKPIKNVDRGGLSSEYCDEMLEDLKS